jgi:hypothetical protein
LYFFLLPSTPEDGARIIKEKFAGAIAIAIAIAIAQPDIQSTLKIDMTSFSSSINMASLSSSKDKPEAQNISELMSMLANEVSE